MSTLSPSQTLLPDATPLQASRWAALVDPVGERLHLLAGVVYVFLLPLAVAPRDIASVALLVITVLRLPKIAPSYRSWLVQPIWWALLAYMAWMCLGLLWTSDVSDGLVDLGKHRMFLTPLLLLPLLSHASLLVRAYLAGMVIVNLLQVMEWFQWPNSEVFPLVSRQGAFNNPIATGLFTAVAICYWLRLLIFGSIRHLWIVIPGLGLAGFGLMLSGSRSTTVAAMIGSLLLLAVPFITQPRNRVRIFVTTVLLAGGMMLAAVTTSSQYRAAFLGFPAAVHEILHSDEEPRSSVGMRVQMIEYGIEVFHEHPVLGTGTGAASRYMPEGIDFHGARGDRVTLHNTYLLALVTLGIPGLLLLLCVLGAALWQAAPLAAGTCLTGGTFYGLVAWMVAAGGDSYQASGNYLGMLGFLLAIGLLGSRPFEATPFTPGEELEQSPNR
ncbi:MAG: O-antigen ligase family protein [Phycisphaerales bacterium]|nr:O-antigen ligase family protein [Phycisphaerales bacterium]